MPAIGKRIVSLVAFLALNIFASHPRSALACGVDTDCQIGARTYRIVLPDYSAETDKTGAIIFAHGFRGTAARAVKNKKLTALASELNVALVAAQAAGPEWNIPHIPTVDASEGIDELAYFDALSFDLAKRFSVDPSKTVVAGFSSGAMMVWHLACFRGTSFAGFVPMSGTFWKPLPSACPTGPVNLIHYHGRDDPIVPLHGRPIKDAEQGDVYDAVALIAKSGTYRPLPDQQLPDLECSRWADGSSHLLELCLFSGKHTWRSENLLRAVRLLLPD